MHSWKRGMTEMKIIIEMQKEQIGSAMCQSITMMSIEDVITLTLPRVSASTCKPMPVREDGEKGFIFVWQRYKPVRTTHPIN